MRVLVCDDQAIIRDGLEMLLRLEREIEVVGKAEDGLQAVELAARLQPDLILMDLKMPGMNGIEATRQIHEQFPQIKILVLTTYDDDEWVTDAVRVGAAGYLLKDTPREKVMEAVRGTVAGKSYLDPGIAGRLIQQLNEPQASAGNTLAEKLSERELAVLRLLARGLNNADIAEALSLSEGTIRNYVSSILQKLDVTDRTQAALLALQYGLGND